MIAESTKLHWRFKDLTRQKIGKLTVVNLSTYNGELSFWNCVCDCGSNVTAQHRLLISGRQFSCGCYRRERAIKNCKALAERIHRDGHWLRKPDGYSAARALYYSYRKHCLFRKREFSITIELFLELTKRHCVYCGCPPSNVRQDHYSSPYVYNGLDRVNNSLGYTPENVAACCKRCNYMKSCGTKEEFLAHIQKILEFRSSI